MKRRIKRTGLLLLALLLGMVTAAGCQSDTEAKKEVSQDQPSEEKKDTENQETIVDGKDNVQVQGSMNGTTYVSKEGNITITLPNDTWKCESDTQDCITFSSDEGMMTILRMEGSEATASSMFHSADEYMAYLKGTTPNLEGEVISFENLEEDGKDEFLSVFHYAGENEFRYAVANGVSFTDYSYLINAMLRTEDESTLTEVKTSIEQCQITE